MLRATALAACLFSLTLAGCGDSASDDDYDELEGKRYAHRYFQVDLHGRSLVSNEPVVDEREADIYRKTQTVLIESGQVLNSALRHDDLSEWESIPEGEETLDWIRERLVVRFPKGSEVLEIALVDRRAPKEALVAAVEAISKAYLNEVVFESKIQRQKPRDILTESYRDLDDEIKRKTNAHQARLKDASSARLPEIAARIELLKQQIARLGDARIGAEQELLRRLVDLELAGSGSGDEADDADDDSDDNEDAEEAGQSASDTEPPMEVVRQAYAKHTAKLDAQIEELTVEVQDLSKDDPNLAARAAEIEGLKSIQSDILNKIEHWDIELKAPDRVSAFGSVEFIEP
ncbi:hypothetical protein Pla123a_17650 [Posidoniimonas polymericola]|uniref:Chromosome partition protein Smc n=1 Tax=Posidoniimonas polymericola TaxID=2528002 RepID=A0A5C5YSV6_9BACT|nr:hypothetical protein [Posidoniimonas polymericola]TWT77966.1 hypothetical protein Pla123a_17650 [Posidoniimonas polymericola]